TEVGAMLGTPQYMSPEQILGRAVDARSDLYSVGVILFELLTGRCPFAGNLPDLLEQHVTAPSPELPASLASREPRVAEILRVLLSREPDGRFQTAKELATALAEASQPSRPGGKATRAAGSRALAAVSTARSAGQTLKDLGRRAQPYLARLASSM